MAHIHSVYDTEPHFGIDPATRVITNLSNTKKTIVQLDHNSERFTFELPRYIDGHDMSLCNAVQVHYINIGDNSRKTGIYRVTDLTVSPDSDDVVICSWLISRNATTLAGSLTFALRFACTTGSTVDYSWGTLPHIGVTVSSGIDNTETTIDQYTDILEEWYARINDLEAKVAELESKMELMKYPYAIVLDEGAFEYFAQGDDDGNSYNIKIIINDSNELTIPDFKESASKYIYGLAKGDRVAITNWENRTLYVTSDGNHIFFSMTDNGGTPLNMDDSVTIIIGGSGYTANIYTTDRGESMTWVTNDEEWEGNADVGIKVTKADGSVRYLDVFDFSEAPDPDKSAVYGRDLYSVTVENAISVEFKGSGFVPEVSRFGQDDMGFDAFVTCDNPYTFSQDGEHVAVHFS